MCFLSSINQVWPKDQDGVEVQVLAVEFTTCFRIKPSIWILTFQFGAPNLWFNLYTNFPRFSMRSLGLEATYTSPRCPISIIVEEYCYNINQRYQVESTQLPSVIQSTISGVSFGCWSFRRLLGCSLFACWWLLLIPQLDCIWMSQQYQNFCVS